HAETGYGYLKLGSALDQNKSAYAIQQFVEKPDMAIAESYLQIGDYLWNSGMFLIKASTWLNALKEYRLDIFESVQQAFEAGRDDYDFYRVDENLFKSTPSESIDYAVMEQLTEKENAKFKGAIIPLDAGWSDVGSWQSIWDIGIKDASGNVRSGDVFLHDSQNSLIMAESRIVAGIGLENIVIVETPDAVMVANKNNSQNVKDIVTQLKAEKRDEALFHRKVYRPWGSYQGVDAGERYQVKHIEVKPGASLSLQMHHHRAEHWIVVSGTARVTRGEEEFILSENESTYIPLGVTHRLENPGTIPLKIIEVQSGTYLGEDDIVRFEDKYGRREP
ncbi:MAG: mannose-1-phosphate guanylyltransferase/mannose-6-phosphate isomerase, partial [Gammaproteobacteria bacterium]|nr:mannose-1-phosphate guanylyltransferase/mannose-6-phosphate isomerase [Gammaproteobacteria bacterium]